MRPRLWSSQGTQHHINWATALDSQTHLPGQARPQRPNRGTSICPTLCVFLSIMPRAYSKTDSRGSRTCRKHKCAKASFDCQRSRYIYTTLRSEQFIDSVEAQRLRTLEEDNRNLTDTLQSFVEEFNVLRPSSGQPVSNFFCSSFVYVTLH